MKRCLAVILTLAMMFSFMSAVIAAEEPALFASDNQEQSAAAEETKPDEGTNNNGKEENGEFSAPNVPINGNQVKKDENNTLKQQQVAAAPLVSAPQAEEAEADAPKENSILPLADGDGEVSYKIDGESTWQGAATFADAVAAINTGTGTVKVLKDIEIAATVKINGNITMLAADDKDVTLKRSGTLTTVPMVEVAKDATLALGTEAAMQHQLIFDGGAVWEGNNGYPNTAADPQEDKSNNTAVRGNSAIIVTLGAMNMYDNVVLQNNHNNASVSGLHTGSGVAVDGGGTFNMYGGKIWKTSSASGDDVGAVSIAGADRNKSYASESVSTFNMYGGEICHNTAGSGAGVSVGNPNFTHERKGAFNMYDGKIHSNITIGSDVFGGGGVCVNHTSSFAMTGGTITENKAMYIAGYGIGGGVECFGDMKMTGGVIRNNTAVTNGDDVYFEQDAEKSTGTLTISLQNVEIDGIQYDVRWYYDGDKGGTSTDRYKEGISEEKTTLTKSTEECALKAIYTEAVAKYKITVKSDDTTNGTVTVDKTEATEGETVTVTATLNNTESKAWYVLADLTVTGADETAIDVSKAEDGTYSFVMPAQNVDIKASFATKLQIEFYSNNKNKKTINEINSVITDYGSIAAEPELPIIKTDMGIVVKDLTYAYDNETYVLKAMAKDGVMVKDIYIKYNKSGYPISYGIVDGTISDDRKTATFTLTPEIMKDIISNTNEYSICPTFNFNVDFEKPQTLTVGTLKNGVDIFNVGTNLNTTTITTNLYEGKLGEGSHSVLHDQTVYLYAQGKSCNDGQSAKKFKLIKTATGEEIEQTPTAIGWTSLRYEQEPWYYSFVMPDYDVTVELYCEYNITVSEMQNGNVTADRAKANDGETVSLTISPNENYELDTLTVKQTDGTAVSVTNNTFIMPQDDVTVEATFKLKGFKITVAEPVNGTLSVSGASNLNLVPAGTQLTVTATPDDNYELDTISVKKSNGTFVTVTSGKFTMPNESVTVSATFKKKQFTASAADNITNGSVSIIQNATAAWGETVVFTVTPDANYELDTLTISGGITPEYDSISGSYSFIMPTEDVTVNATFKKKQFTVSASGANATVSAFADSYEWGAEVTFTVTPDEWYIIREVTAAGVIINKGEDNTYSFTMPANNVDITVTTERPKFNITFDAKDGSAVDGQVVENGNTIVKPTAPERLGYGFAGWYTDETYTQKYNFTAPVTEDVTLYARWFMWGDVNCDGIANSADSLLISRWYAKRIGAEDLACPMAARVSAADKVQPNSADGLLISRKYAKRIEVFPVEISAKGYEFDLENNTYYPPQN